MKKGRRKSREDALQILYQLELDKEKTVESALEQFAEHYSRGESDRGFVQRLVEGVRKQCKALDKTIAQYAENWRPDRMSVIDKNILRMGVFELLHCDDIPATVTINEMIELAKEFGSDNSASFVNGILDKVRKTSTNPAKAP